MLLFLFITISYSYLPYCYTNNTLGSKAKKTPCLGRFNYGMETWFLPGSECLPDRGGKKNAPEKI
jgi:hypothetical protein